MGVGLFRGGGNGKNGGWLLTDGPSIRRLRKVLGYLPVDVKPAESKGDRREVGTKDGAQAARVPRLGKP